MIILIWNCQGAASREVGRTLKEMIWIHKPQVLGLLEPKISGYKADEVCKKLVFEDWIRVEALGFSGGIWVLWRSSIHVNVIRTHTQFIFLQVKEGIKEPWNLAVVYGSPSYGLRNRLWRDLRIQSMDVSGPWIAAGDFNAVVSEAEVSDPAKFKHNKSVRFRDWIFDQGLIDMGFEGPRLTWRRGSEDTIIKGARLDRVLANGDWCMRFQNTSVKHLPMLHSDHSPLLINLDCQQQRKKKHNFRFCAEWLMDKSFYDTVNQAWRQNDEFSDNIKNIIPTLEEWNRQVFGNLNQKKKRLLARIAGIQRKILINNHTGLVKLERKLQKELDDILLQEEIRWFQKSREEWIVSGDRNTQFYHMATIIKRKNNKVTRLLSYEGHVVTGVQEMKNLMLDYFTTLFKRDNNCNGACVIRGCFPEMNHMVRSDSMKDITNAEIKAAVMEMASLKAPGLDGLHAAISQKM